MAMMADSSSTMVALRSASAETDTPSLEAVYVEHGAYVGRLALRLVGSPAEAEDIRQEVFVAALGGLRALRDPHKARSWLRTVTVRTCRRHLRGRIFLRQTHTPLLDHDAASERDLLAARALEQALQRLPKDERIAWALRFVEELELTEVAEATGCSLATVKRRLAKATDRLQRGLNDER